MTDGEQDAQVFGRALHERRTRAGLSLADLASLVHFSRGFLSRIENGHRRVSRDLAELCDTVLDAHGELAALATDPGQDTPRKPRDAARRRPPSGLSLIHIGRPVRRGVPAAPGPRRPALSGGAYGGGRRALSHRPPAGGGRPRGARHGRGTAGPALVGPRPRRPRTAASAQRQPRGARGRRGPARRRTAAPAQRAPGEEAVHGHQRGHRLAARRSEPRRGTRPPHPGRPHPDSRRRHPLRGADRVPLGPVRLRPGRQVPVAVLAVAGLLHARRPAVLPRRGPDRAGHRPVAGGPGARRLRYPCPARPARGPHPLHPGPLAAVHPGHPVRPVVRPVRLGERLDLR